MNILDIPFNRFLSLQPHETDRRIMSLRYAPELTNHIGTMHASAQFALAEACSGQFMLTRFPEEVDGNIALLRKSEVKYKRPAKSDIVAEAWCDDGTIEGFISRLERKHRSFLPVDVAVRDEEGIVTMQGTFEWYIEKREASAV